MNTRARSAIVYAYERSRAMAEQAALANSMGDVQLAAKLIAEANVVLQSVQILERDLGKKVVTGPRPTFVTKPTPEMIVSGPANDMSGETGR